MVCPISARFCGCFALNSRLFRGCFALFRGCFACVAHNVSRVSRSFRDHLTWNSHSLTVLIPRTEQPARLRIRAVDFTITRDYVAWPGCTSWQIAVFGEMQAQRGASSEASQQARVRRGGR
eukprot:5167964-Prymnesium_polylepis.1